MSWGSKPTNKPSTNSTLVCAFKCNRDVAIAPMMMHIKAMVPLILILKWMLNAMANIKNPALAIIWMLALILKIAKNRHANVEKRMPKKK